MIRVGRRKYAKNGSYVDPIFPGFTSILVLLKGHSEWGVLGPYELKDDNGRIMENLYQASKVYPKVPATTQYYSRWNKTITWQHPEEIHYLDGEIQAAYWLWREKLNTNKYFVRYPVGRTNTHTCIFSMKEGEFDTKLNYVEGRKKVYAPLYMTMVKKQPKYTELKNRLKAGENLLIIEVDGPHQESLDYYKSQYAVDDSFIENETMLASSENLNLMLNDVKHPFGHGYCLAMALLDLENLIEQ